MERPGEERVRDVLVGVDGSAGSVDVISQALGIAARWGAPVTVVQAWELPPTSSDVSSPRWHTSMGAVIDADTRRLVATAQAAQPRPVPVAVRAVEGPSGPVLVELSPQARLLVVGPPTGGRLRHDAGSTVWYVMSHARCPVEVVGIRPDEAAGLFSTSV